MDVPIFILFLCSVFSSGVWCKRHVQIKKGSGGKIVGGYNATILEYPYQAYLRMQQGLSLYQCGGSIIHPRFVLTAAHCLAGMQRAYIRIGSTNSDSGGYQYQSSFFVTHPKYNAMTSDYDAGMIRLFRNMNLDGKMSKVIALPETNATVPAGSDVTVTGWGTTSEGGQTSDTLMAVTVPVISNEDCKKLMNGITDRMICAGLPEGGKDSCQGDSGGPAASDDTMLVGIVSFGIGCARPNYPGVYTRVSAIKPWIMKVMTGQ